MSATYRCSLLDIIENMGPCKSIVEEKFALVPYGPEFSAQKPWSSLGQSVARTRRTFRIPRSFIAACLVDNSSEEQLVDLSGLSATRAGLYSRRIREGVRYSLCPNTVVFRRLLLLM